MDEYTGYDLDPDPDADALIETIAHLRSAEIALRPVLIRMEERRRARIAMRRTRAQQSASPRERRSA